MEAGHHAGEHVHGEREPGPPARLAGLLVHDDHVDLGVVDLHDLKRPRGRVAARRGLGRLQHGRIAAPSGPCPQINLGQAPLDRAPVRRLQALLVATGPHLVRQAGERRLGRLEIELVQRLADHGLALGIEQAQAFRAPLGTWHQGGDGAPGPETPDQAVEAGPAQPELPGHVVDRGVGQALRMAAQEVPDGLFAPARLVPVRLVVPNAGVIGFLVSAHPVFLPHLPPVPADRSRCCLPRLGL